jgi:hypothetical protein
MLLEKYQASHIWKDGKRYYLTPTGKHYPGVTTILGNTKTEATEKALASWRKRVGVEEAKLITKTAAARGTAMHSAIEATLSNEPFEIEKIAEPYFESIMPVLMKVNNIRLIEGAVWHPNGFAGSVDCVAEYNGVLSVIDWKTSDRTKNINWINDYFLQAAAYTAAVNRLYDLRIGQTVIAIAIAGQCPQVFKVDGRLLLEYWETFNYRLKKYQSQVGYGNDANTIAIARA